MWWAELLRYRSYYHEYEYKCLAVIKQEFRARYLREQRNTQYIGRTATCLPLGHCHTYKYIFHWSSNSTWDTEQGWRSLHMQGLMARKVITVWEIAVEMLQSTRWNGWMESKKVARVSGANSQVWGIVCVHSRVGQLLVTQVNAGRKREFIPASGSVTSGWSRPVLNFLPVYMSEPG